MEGGLNVDDYPKEALGQIPEAMWRAIFTSCDKVIRLVKKN
jgi:hypothetical protein